MMLLTLALMMNVASAQDVKNNNGRSPSPPYILWLPPVTYPPEMYKRGLVGAPRLQLTISASGQLLHCTMVRSSGNDDADANACKAMQDAKFRPARDSDGKPIVGVFAIDVVYMLENKITNSSPSADLQLVVERLPGGAKTFEDRVAALTVDETGKVEACQVKRPKDQNDGLVRAMCKMATSELTFRPALDANSKPVRSIQRFVVEFSQADAPLTRKLDR